MASFPKRLFGSPLRKVGSPFSPIGPVVRSKHDQGILVHLTFSGPGYGKRAGDSRISITMAKHLRFCNSFFGWLLLSFFFFNPSFFRFFFFFLFSVRISVVPLRNQSFLLPRYHHYHYDRRHRCLNNSSFSHVLSDVYKKKTLSSVSSSD